MNRKVFLIVGVIFLVFINFFIIFNPFNQLPEVTLVDDLIVIRNSEVTNLDFVKDVKNGKVVSKEELVDTSELGKKEIVLVIENNFGKKRDYLFFIEIVEE